MPYSRRVPKVDIRNLHIDTSGEPNPPAEKSKQDSPPTAVKLPVGHNPAAELKTIAWCGLPLILVLIIATIFDHYKGWVIPLAEWLMSR